VHQVCFIIRIYHDARTPERQKPIHILVTSRSLLPTVRNVSDRRSTENQNTHPVFSNFFCPGNRAFYEIMWKNMVEPDRPDDNIIRRMRFACWIPKSTNTYSEYVILIDK